MASHSKRHSVSEQTKQDAMAVAKGTQKPGQSKEQTKLIAQGIQKGIEQYKKQQKAKAREIDKQRKKPAMLVQVDNADDALPQEVKAPVLPWMLLACSWLFFVGVWFWRW